MAVLQVSRHQRVFKQTVHSRSWPHLGSRQLRTAWSSLKCSIGGGSHSTDRATAAFQLTKGQLAVLASARHHFTFTHVCRLGSPTRKVLLAVEQSASITASRYIDTAASEASHHGDVAPQGTPTRHWQRASCFMLLLSPLCCPFRALVRDEDSTQARSSGSRTQQITAKGGC